MLTPIIERWLNTHKHRFQLYLQNLLRLETWRPSSTSDMWYARRVRRKSWWLEGDARTRKPGIVGRFVSASL